jgi:hypothetical protein
MNRWIWVVCLFFVAILTWENLKVSLQLGVPSQNEVDAILPLQVQPKSSTSAQEFSLSKNQNATKPQLYATTTKILGFADAKYIDHALRWYQRLEKLGYSEHAIVAVDREAADYFQREKKPIRFEVLPYPPCISHDKDPRKYRRQLFARRWRYVYEQLSTHHVLLTDVDNVFSRFVPMSAMEDSDVDAFHAYSTAYPVHVFENMGFTVCGGMGWLRSTQKVRQFVGSLLSKCKCLKTVDCNCYCDDQVELNQLLWKGKHNVTWDRPLGKPKSQDDWQWRSITGVSAKTRHRIKIWDRNFAYRAPMPDSCPENNWVAMPLYVNRSDVIQEWDHLCSSSKLDRP